jgi:predicted GNAT superfamily acetyltransferase
MSHPALIRRVNDEVTIRRAETVADFRACQEAQRLAWGITEDGYVIPVATMVGANLHGGLVLGAFLPDGKAVGMSFGFLGRIEGRLCLYSQLTGVVPGAQSLGLGYELKLAQRDFARAEGLTLIAWAFDPLQAGNARFNLDKLGARVRRYVENMYGTRTDALNAGVPTDRLIAEWEITTDTHGAGATPAATADLPLLIRTGRDDQDRRVPIGVEPVGDSPRALLEIPDRIADLRREQPEVAEAWRVAVRQAFQDALAAGYQAVEFARDETPGRRRGFYVLERSDARP